MITNISSPNKDGIRMSIGEYDLTKRSLRLWYSKGRLDSAMKLKHGSGQHNESFDGLPTEVKVSGPLPQVLSIKVFDIPEDAVEVVFIDKDFDNRFVSTADALRASLVGDSYEVDLATLKRIR